jgi:hypothetical protein
MFGSGRKKGNSSSEEPHNSGGGGSNIGSWLAWVYKILLKAEQDEQLLHHVLCSAPAGPTVAAEKKRHGQKCSSSGEAGSQPRDSTNAPLTKSEARERPRAWKKKNRDSGRFGDGAIGEIRSGNQALITC